MRARYLYLLIGLLLYFAVAPVAVQFLPEQGSILMDLALAVVLITGVRSLAGADLWHRVTIVLAGVGISMEVANLYFEDTWLVVCILVVALMLALIVALVALRDVLFGGEIDLDRLTGSICVYLLMGIAWTFVFSLVSMASPDAFHGVTATPMETHAGVLEFMYFSFVTLTTLGYGDISPVSPVAQTLVCMEAVAGQLYLTILVAALVGMLLSRRDEVAASGAAE